eukprot:Trichotokara_eunicae@DN5797_c0_g1_i4.p1
MALECCHSFLWIGQTAIVFFVPLSSCRSKPSLERALVYGWVFLPAGRLSVITDAQKVNKFSSENCFCIFGSDKRFITKLTIHSIAASRLRVRLMYQKPFLHSGL